MKEYGPRGIQPENKLTVQGQKPYAERRGITMPEGGEGPRPPEPQETPREENGTQEVERTPLDPIQLGLYKKFEEDHGRPPHSTTEKGILNWAAEVMTQSGSESKEDREVPQESQKVSNTSESVNEPISPPHQQHNEVNRQQDNVRRLPPPPEASPFFENASLDSGAEFDEVVGEYKGGESPLAKEFEKRYGGRTEYSRNDEVGGWGDHGKVKRPEAAKLRGTPLEVRPVSGGDHTEDNARRERKIADAKNTWYYKKGNKENGEPILDDEGKPVPYRMGFTRSRAFLPEKIRGELKEDMYGLSINNVEALAAEIMDSDQTTDFQVGAEFQLLNEKGEFQPDNFLHWVRTWMMHWHDEDPDGKWDFGKIIGLKRDYNAINIDSLVERPGRYFRSGHLEVDQNGQRVAAGEQGEGLVYEELVDQIKREIWLFNASRTFDIDYKAAMGRDEDLAKGLNQMFFSNTFTKSVWNQRSALYWITNMPQRFKEVKSKAGELQKEAHVGEALTAAYLAYYNLSDVPKLKEIFGKDTKLLNREAIKDALEAQMEKEHIPEQFKTLEKYISKDDMNDLNGNVIDFINIFNQPQKSPRIVNVVRTMIREELAKKFDMTYWAEDSKTGEMKKKTDETSVRYADTFALSMARWTGAAARNDTKSVGFDFWSKLQHTEPYREKQVDPRRIGGFGNPHTVHQFKQIGLDFVTGVQALGGDTTLEIMGEMYRVREDEEVKEEEKYEQYEALSSQLVFADNAMRGFTVDHFNRVFGVYSQLMDSESIDFDKFTKFDLIDGLTFDRGQFEKAVKENFFKPMRYAWSTYKGVDYSKEVRAFDPKTKEYNTVHVAEAMFGRQILDIPPLWKEGMEHIKVTDANWSEKIDWDNVNTDQSRIMLWHRAALMRLAAEYYAHRDRHNNEPRFDFRYYEQVMMAIDSLPSNLAGDETDMKGSKSFGSAFTEEEKKWLREMSNTGKMRLFMGGLGKGLATEGAKGLADAGTALLKGIAA